mmetsp:Transcript_90093/g.259725  ORF Transcript_90093/g.259725 Transcript_90093/m.259725 type:complete len:362 (-) Transcript_90093:26-1111(-)
MDPTSLEQWSAYHRRMMDLAGNEANRSAWTGSCDTLTSMRRNFSDRDFAHDLRPRFFEDVSPSSRRALSMTDAGFGDYIKRFTIGDAVRAMEHTGAHQPVPAPVPEHPHALMLEDKPKHPHTPKPAHAQKPAYVPSPAIDVLHHHLGSPVASRQHVHAASLASPSRAGLYHLPLASDVAMPGMPTAAPQDLLRCIEVMSHLQCGIPQKVAQTSVGPRHLAGNHITHMAATPSEAAPAHPTTAAPAEPPATPSMVVAPPPAPAVSVPPPRGPPAPRRAVCPLPGVEKREPPVEARIHAQAASGAGRLPPKKSEPGLASPASTTSTRASIADASPVSETSPAGPPARHMVPGSRTERSPCVAC